MWEILPDLFLGDRGDASDRERLRQRGITHIVNCSKELRSCFESEFQYLWLRLEDPDPDFGEKIPMFCEFIEAGRRTGKVMVHCIAGFWLRSAWLWQEELPDPDEVLREILAGLPE